ncbi:MAG: lysophospholipid acyltransferase family protein [Oscillospiraceae bacterium]|nr:lysophospholipid acyltransferase family protein [Oscillospiraceae bacterium]
MKRPALFFRAIYQFVLRVTAPLAVLVLRIRFRGIRKIPHKGPFIVCCNHRSVIDPWLLAIGFRQHLYFIAKSELFTDHGPHAARFLSAMGAIPIRRNCADRKGLRMAEKVLERGDVVGIFPQGKVLFDNAPFRPKSGAILLAAYVGVPIVPVSIWCKGPWKPFKKVTIRFGKPIPAETFAGAEKDRQQMRKCSKLLADIINSQLEEGHHP